MRGAGTGRHGGYRSGDEVVVHCCFNCLFIEIMNLHSLYVGFDVCGGVPICEVRIYVYVEQENKEGTDQRLDRLYVQDRRTGGATDLMQDAWQTYGGRGNRTWDKARGWRVAWVVGVITVGPPFGVDPVGKMRLRISNKQTNKKFKLQGWDGDYIKWPDKEWGMVNVLNYSHLWFRVVKYLPSRQSHWHLIHQ